MPEITDAMLDELEQALDAAKDAPDKLIWFPLDQARGFFKAFRACLHERDRLKAINAELLGALERVAEGKGAFNRDPLEHASNVIDEAKATARAALAKARKVEP